MKIVTVTPADGELLARYYRGIYWADFAAQHEPLEAWQDALAGSTDYELTIRLAVEEGEILGGISFERYPVSGCGLITYMVVAEAARRRGLGKRLQADAISTMFAAGAPAVFGEVNDPRLAGTGLLDEPVEDSWERLVRNENWGARVVDCRYIQPALGLGLERDRGLCLIAHAGYKPLPDTMPGAIVRAFVGELYAKTEGSEPDAELHALLAEIPETVRLVDLRP
jgi:GNAT superfamily N-acetyltransferase